VLAVDGTTLRLPDVARIRKSFAAMPVEVPLGRLVELYDVLNHIMLGAQLSQLEIGEGYQAEQGVQGQDLIHRGSTESGLDS